MLLFFFAVPILRNVGFTVETQVTSCMLNATRRADPLITELKRLGPRLGRSSRARVPVQTMAEINCCLRL